ncbi:MAG TPA: hypothetical protein VMB79_09145 [Jatrophihabitans sp.]|nr:hypothetical protein [Jatrophihabitans sp.]
MSRTRILVSATVLAGVSIAGLVVGIQPAGAVTSGPLSCYSDSGYVYCTETTYPNPSWTFDFSGQPADYGKTSVSYRCGNQGKAWFVSVSVTGVVNGPGDWSVQGTCSTAIP